MKAIKHTFLAFLFIFLTFSTAMAQPLSYYQSIDLKQKGHYTQAENAFKKLIKKNKNNAEYWFQLGLTQRYQNKVDEALNSQQKALKLSPKNADIKLELARLYQYKGNNEQAKKWVQEVLMNYPDYIEATNLLAQLERKPTPQKNTSTWGVDVGHERSYFSRQPQADWRTNFLQINYWVKPKKIFSYFRTENHKRFFTHNEYYELGGTYIFNNKNSFYTALGHTPNSTFMPKWRFKAGGEFNIQSATPLKQLTLATQYDRYNNSSDTITIKPGFRLSLPYSTFIHAQHINIVDENDKHLTGWVARGDWQPQHYPKANIFMGLSRAPETEDAQTVKTSARFLGISYNITNKNRVYLSYAREDRDNSYIRKILSASIATKF